MSAFRSIFWFRHDLRLADNPGLSFALSKGDILPIFIMEDKAHIGAASRVWLHRSLLSLNQSLDYGLCFYQGDALDIIETLVQKNDIKGVYWNRCYDPYRIKIDTAIKNALITKGIDCQSFNSNLLFEPWDVKKSDGGYYKVFTPFYNACLKMKVPRLPLEKAKNMTFIKDKDSIKLDDLNLLPKVSWYKKILRYWGIGELSAHQRLIDFKEEDLKGYSHGRDIMTTSHTSRLSPHLHFGEISPHQIWDAIQVDSVDAITFKKELIWREFSNYLLYYFPTLQTQNFNPKFDRFEWEKNNELLDAWKKGQTGIPIVDAGMRELWLTGTMHNRVRMIVASFLVKNCLINWQEGEKWFFNCLLDADIASNSFNWQWVAGSGVDAAPYFRIFNPVLQGHKFDPEALYIKKFVPELNALSVPYIFEPSNAPFDELQRAGITMGTTYPFPIVDLKLSRQEALERYKRL